MSSREIIIYEGPISRVPYKLSNEMELPFVNRIIKTLTDIMARIVLVYAENDLMVEPCRSCFKSGRSSCTALYNIKMLPSGPVSAKINYDVEIVCNGMEGHASGKRYKLMLSVT